jgi:hypothetical protein
MTSPRVAALSAWAGTVLVVGGLSAAALAVAGLPLAATLGVGLLAALVTLLTAGAVLVAVRTRMAPPQAAGSGCGACGQSCLAGSGSVASRECSSTS